MSEELSQKTVVIGPADYALYCASGRACLLHEGYQLIENLLDRPWSRAELLEVIGQADAAIVGVEAWDAEVFAVAPRLKVLTKLGVGLDNIDLDAARRSGISVANAPGGNSNAVAELTVGLILSALREIPRMDAVVRAGSWARVVGPELSGKTVGLVGFGNIGALVARRLAGFENRVLAYDPFPQPEKASKLGVELLDLDEVLAESEIVSLHLPSTPETHHFVNDSLLSKVRLGAYLVNTARGALVDEGALYRALSSGRLAGAALDVFEHEPIDPKHPLLSLPNVSVTTHAAADTFEAYQAIGLINAKAIITVLNGGSPENLAN